MGRHHTEHEHSETLHPDALLGFLRSTGEALARGEIVIGDRPLPLEALGEYKLSVKVDGDELKVKLRARERDAAAPQAAEDTPQRHAYRALKREMKKSYQAICSNLEAGVLPPDALVARFVASVEQAAGHPAEAEPLYKVLRQSLEDLRQALGRDDVPGALEIVQQIDELRHDAHRAFR